MREMKDSGVQWIGEIPTTWAIITLKYTHDGMNVGESIDKEYWEESDGDRVFYTAGLNPITTTYRHFPPEKYTRDNDLLLARNGTPYVYLPVENSVYTDHIIRVKVKNEYSKKFIMYCLQRSIDAEIVDTVSIATWSASIWNRQCFPLPPHEEQEVITSFLDTKCAEIDALSADIQKEIETLQEYRKSVITEAVTKGLDPNVEMKDSGIEWIGEIPMNWNVHRISNYFSERNVKNNLGLEQNLLSLSYGKIIRKDINSNGGLLPESFNTYNIIEAGDIIIRPTDLQNDKRSLRTGLVCEHGIITSAYIDLAPKNNVISKFYHYQLHAFDIEKVFYNMGNGVRQGLNYNEFAKLLVVEPPVDEQLLILKFLDTKCSEIDSIISDKQKQLETLAEYRKSLIYEYVTGKKEVPEC